MEFELPNATHCKWLAGEHMTLNNTGVPVPRGTAVSVGCENGYTLLGDPVVTCGVYATWSDTPYCKEADSSGMSPAIIAITTLATLVALGILVCSVYMLIKNCSFEKLHKTSAKAYEEKMRTISDCFGVSQDCVGLPAVTPDNWDDKIRGRSITANKSAASRPPTNGLANSLAAHFEPDREEDGKKQFLY